MLNQPMMEKLLAMRLQGMVEGLKAQEQRSGMLAGCWGSGAVRSDTFSRSGTMRTC